MSVLNPILLINAYEASKENLRKMAQSFDEKMILQLRHTKKIKDQWAFFVNIELGKYSIVFFYHTNNTNNDYNRQFSKIDNFLLK